MVIIGLEIKNRLTARLVNLRASGLYMCADRFIENGSRLSITILITGSFADNDIPKIATYGIVVRSELKIDGTCGIAVKFNSYRFQ